MSATLTMPKMDNKVSNFDFSQLFDNFNCPDVNLFLFDGVTLTLKPGSTTTSIFLGDLQMTGFLEPFKNLLNGSESIPVTATIETALGLKKKISPQKLSLSSVAPFHVPLFLGVTLSEVSLEVDMVKNGDAWSFVPSLVGILQVDGISDTDQSKIKLQVVLDKGVLKLSANGKNISGAFGLTHLMLDEVNIEGTLGAEKQLSLTSSFEVGPTNFNFNGTITPNGVGMAASAKDFNLNQLASLFKEVSTASLTLPDFDVDFNNTSIAFATAACTVGNKKLEKGLSLAADITAHGYTVTSTADITPNGVAFSGAIGNLEVGPVAITTAGLDFQIYTKASGKSSLFTIHGEAVIQHVSVDVGVYFEKQVASWVTLLYANVSAKQISLSTFFPESKGSIMDQLSLSKMSFIYASADCTPKRLPSVKSAKKGLQLVANVKEIPGLSTLTKEDNLDLELTAFIGNTVGISVALPDTSLDLGSSVVTDPFKIAITIAPQPSIALVFGMEVTIPNQTQPLHFDMVLDISTIEATGSVTMKNYWRKPFGIDGVKIGPAVAMQLGINYAQFASSGTPSTFGLAGGLAIGDTIMDMAVNISTNPLDEILAGTLKELDIKEVVVFATDTCGVDIPSESIPDFLDIKNLQFYLAPAGGTIGTITYDKGISFACDMVFLDKEFDCYARISDNGIEGGGKLDQIDIGPLKVSGENGKDMAMTLALTPTVQHLSIDGAISFLDAKVGTFVNVSTSGVEFKFEENFFNQLTFDMQGKSSGTLADPSSLDFQLSADMQNDITSFLKNDVTNKINSAIKTVTDDIDAAQKKVDDAEKVYNAQYDKAEEAVTNAQSAADAYLKQVQAEVDKANADFKNNVGKAQTDLNTAKAAYDKAFNDANKAVEQTQQTFNSGVATAQEAVANAERDFNSGVASAQSALNSAEKAYNNSIGSAQSAVNSAQQKVNSLLGDINSTKRTIDNLPWYEKPAAAYYGAKLAGYYTAYGVATAALTTANAVLDGIKHGGSFVAFQSAKAALQAAKTGAKYTAFTAAQAALVTAKTGANLVAFNAAKATLAAVQHGTEYTAWQAAEKSLALAKSVGNAAIAVANKAMADIANSATYVALSTAKLALVAVKTGSAAVAFGAAKAALAAAKLGSTATLSLASFIASHSGDIFDVKSMHLSGSLVDIEKGDLFDAALDVSVLGNNYSWNMDLNIKDVGSFIDALFQKAFAEAKSIAGV